jgi:hypothetical protein
MTKARDFIAVVVAATLVTSCQYQGGLDTTVYVAPQSVPCDATSRHQLPETCLQIQRTLDSPVFLNTVAQFDFQPGFRYKLRVHVESVQFSVVTESDINAGALLRYLETLEKTPAQ